MFLYILRSYKVVFSIFVANVLLSLSFSNINNLLLTRLEVILLTNFLNIISLHWIWWEKSLGSTCKTHKNQQETIHLMEFIKSFIDLLIFSAFLLYTYKVTIKHTLNNSKQQDAKYKNRAFGKLKFTSSSICF